MGKKNIFKNRGRTFSKLGKNSRPTEERRTKKLKQKKQKTKQNSHQGSSYSDREKTKLKRKV